MALLRTVEIVEGTADVAFAIDRSGLVSAWNAAAVEFFGLQSHEAIGRPCHEIIQGTDEGGVTCSDHCAIRKALELNQPVANFDLQVQTKSGRVWCNVSVLFVTDTRTTSTHAVHIVHPRELRKRLEQVMRDFLVSNTELSEETSVQLLSSVRLAAGNVKLTSREIEILRLLAKGLPTKAIADHLTISDKTVDKHITHILAKLGVHSRLEAVRRAERAGLI